MGRSPCCDDSGLKKGPWTPEEDDKLIHYIQQHGHGSWRALPKLAGLNRCGKSCRLRWTNYLRPDIKRGKFSQEEEQTILNLHAILGNKWSTIATHLPGRTDNEIKNYWNTRLKKKLIQMGFDPMTHWPRADIFSSLSSLIALVNLKGAVENPTWEEQAMRLQVAEAAQMAPLNQYLKQLLSIQNNAAAQEFSDLSLLCNSSVSLGHLESAHQPAYESTVAFSHLPGLQGGASLDQAVLSCDDHHRIKDNAASSAWYNPSQTAPHLMTESWINANMGGDECSGTHQIWSEFLDDPIFLDAA